MKITVETKHFNEAIRLKKFEVCEWLLANFCPADSSAYLQDMTLDTSTWLLNNGVPMGEGLLSSVISRTSDKVIIDWFYINGCSITSDCVDACIEKNDVELLSWFVKAYDIPLNVDNFIAAAMTESYEILDYLKNMNCPYSKSVLDSCMKYSKPDSIKWICNNGYF